MMPYWDKLITKMKDSGIKGTELSPYIYSRLNVYCDIVNCYMGLKNFEKGLQTCNQALELLESSKKAGELDAKSSNFPNYEKHFSKCRLEF